MQHALQGSAQIADAGGRRIIRIVGEDFKEVATDDRITRGHGGAKVSVAGRNNREVRGKDEIEPGRTLEQRLKIGGSRRIRQFHPAVF